MVISIDSDRVGCRSRCANTRRDGFITTIDGADVEETRKDASMMYKYIVNKKISENEKQKVQTIANWISQNRLYMFAIVSVT